MGSNSPPRKRGRPPYPGLFTPAEERVLAGLRRGLTYQQVADELQVSYDTVKYHVSNMLSKAGVASRDELVARPNRAKLASLFPWLSVRIVATAAGVAAAVAGTGVLFATFFPIDQVADDQVADGSAELETATSTSPGTPTPMPGTGTVTPTGSPTRPNTGVHVVDDVIDAVIAHDSSRFSALVSYHPTACSVSPQGIGGPPGCPPGVADGTTLPAISGSYCEGGMSLKSEFERSIPGLLQPLDEVVAVSRLDDGDYAVTFAMLGRTPAAPHPGPPFGLTMMVNDQGVYATVSGCGDSAFGLAMRYPDFVIAPAPVVPPADLPATGVAALDSAIALLAGHDLMGIRERVVLSSVACASVYGTNPPCPANVADGTQVEAFAYEDCGYSQWMPPGEALATVDRALFFAGNLFAVSREALPGGLTFVAVFSRADGRSAWFARITDAGRIVLVNGGCDASAAALAAERPDYLIPPP